MLSWSRMRAPRHVESPPFFAPTVFLNRRNGQHVLTKFYVQQLGPNMVIFFWEYAPYSQSITGTCVTVRYIVKYMKLRLDQVGFVDLLQCTTRDASTPSGDLDRCHMFDLMWDPVRITSRMRRLVAAVRHQYQNGDGTPIFYVCGVFLNVVWESNHREYFEYVHAISEICGAYVFQVKDTKEKVIVLTGHPAPVLHPQTEGRA